MNTKYLISLLGFGCGALCGLALQASSAQALKCAFRPTNSWVLTLESTETVSGEPASVEQWPQEAVLHYTTSLEGEPEGLQFSASGVEDSGLISLLNSSWDFCQ